MSEYGYSNAAEGPRELTQADIDQLLKIAERASISQRPFAIKKLALALSSTDPFTQSLITERVKAAGLATKQDFRKAVKYFSEQISAAQQDEPKERVPTEDELADWWLEEYPLTAYGLGSFRAYNNGVWEEVPKDTIRASILNNLVYAKEEGIRPTAHLVASVTELVRLKTVIRNDRWDADPDYLACKNGTLHIPTRTLLPHSPKYFLTSCVPYEYTPDAQSDIWLSFLDETQPKSKDFLQEFAGYALTTDTSHEIALWLYGQPGGGKSTFLAGLQAMLGPRAGLLGLADIVRSDFALTNLPGKTLVVSTEQPGGFLKIDYLLNAIISGEPIPVNRKFRDPIEITPHAKIAWAMNELPRVQANSGLFRRVHVIEFPPLAEQKRDPRVKERIKQEGAGILNWALEGYARLRARGAFDIPARVREANEQFQENSDVAGLFVAERCEIGEGFSEQSSKLYAAYETWCYTNGHQKKSNTAIAEDWRRLGFTKFKVQGRSHWRGVKVIPQK